MRLPPENIQVLLPVWGERYTRDFLELCLPSLMAPGNVPGLAKLARCTFVLLAPVRDAEVIERSLLWQLLLDCCPVRVEHIDDLISQSSSTVLTLAYALAIRKAGKEALDTCFVPLVADYVVADGSLLAAVKRIVAGASGVLAGNFQLTREIALPCLEKWKTDAGVLAIPSRALVELSFKALHRTTRDEIVNESPTSGMEVNRLFWRVDEHCLVGRFFLMHMIAIRPETSEFIIAAPSDYSLVPELCPSGEIVRMTDSDDYFVIEFQPQNDKPRESTADRLEPRSFANLLAGWATAMHHENARSAVIFHDEQTTPRLAEILAASDKFVSEIEASRAATSMPYRHHPFWSLSLDYHVTTALMEQDVDYLAEITGDLAQAKRSVRGSGLRSILLGRAPYFRPWHPRWADVRMLKQSLAVAKGDLAIVSDVPARVRAWFDRGAGEGQRESTTHLRPADFRGDANSERRRPDVQFDSLLFISDQVPAGLAQLLPRLAAFVRPNGIIVLAIGALFSETERELTVLSVPSEPSLTTGGLSLQKTTCVTAGASRVAIQTTMMQYARKSIRMTSFWRFFWLAAAGGLAVISMFFNIASGRRKPPEWSRFSSLFLTLRKTEN